MIRLICCLVLTVGVLAVFCPIVPTWLLVVFGVFSLRDMIRKYLRLD